MIKRWTRRVVRNADFRLEVLERLQAAHPRRIDFAPVIYALAGREGKSLRYYAGILELLVEKKFIVLDIAAIQDFERSNGAFDDFPLRAMMTPDSIDEYYRLRKQEADVLNGIDQQRRRVRTDVFAWILLFCSVLASAVALGKIFHWFGD